MLASRHHRDYFLTFLSRGFLYTLISPLILATILTITGKGDNGDNPIYNLHKKCMIKSMLLTMEDLCRGQLACFWALSVTVTCRYVMPMRIDGDDGDDCDYDMHIYHMIVYAMIWWKFCHILSMWWWMCFSLIVHSRIVLARKDKSVFQKECRYPYYIHGNRSSSIIRIIGAVSSKRDLYFKLMDLKMMDGWETILSFWEGLFWGTNCWFQGVYMGCVFFFWGGGVAAQNLAKIFRSCWKDYISFPRQNMLVLSSVISLSSC